MKTEIKELIMKQKIKHFIYDPKMNFIIKSSMVSFIAKVIAVLIGLGINLIISRFYGAETLGVIAIINSILLFATMLTVAGMDEVLLRIIPEYETKGISVSYLALKKVLILTSLFSILMCGVLYKYSELIALDIFHHVELKILIEAASFFIIIRSFQTIQLQAFRAFKMIKSFSFMPIFQNFIILIGLISLMNIIDNKDLPVYIYLLSSLVAVIVGFIILFKNRIKKVVHSHIPYTQIISLSLPMMLSGSMMYLTAQTDIIMLGMLSSVENVGIYSIDIRLSTLTGFVIFAIISMLAPEFSRLYYANKFDDLEYVVKKSVIFVFWTTVPISVIIIIFGRPLLSIFGEEFSLGYYALVILTFGHMIGAITGPTTSFLNMTGNHKKLMYIMMITAVINVILNALLIPVYDINGAAFATMFSTIMMRIISLYVIKKKFGFLMIHNPFSFKRIFVESKK